MRAVTFQATKSCEGYDHDQVDDLLDRVVASLRSDGEAGAGASTPAPSGLPVARPLTPLRLVGLVIVAFMIGMFIYFVVLAS